MFNPNHNFFANLPSFDDVFGSVADQVAKLAIEESEKEDEKVVPGKLKEFVNFQNLSKHFT